MTDETAVLGPAVEPVPPVAPSVLDGGLTVAQAAEVMGLSREAMRQRIRRKKVQARKIDGQWYVYPALSPTLSQVNSPTTSPIQSNKPVEHTVDYSVVVDQLRDEVAFLRDELRRKDELYRADQDTRRREVQELHVLLQRAQAQIPMPTLGAEPDQTHKEQATTTEPKRRPWWSRLFSFP